MSLSRSNDLHEFLFDHFKKKSQSFQSIKINFWSISLSPPLFSLPSTVAARVKGDYPLFKS